MFSLWHNFSIILIFFVTFGRWTFRTQTWTQNGNKEHEARLKGRWEPKLATWNFRFRVPRSKNPTWLERGKFMNTFLIPGFKKYSTFLKLATQATLQPMLFFKVLRQDSLLSTHQIHSLKLTVCTYKWDISKGNVIWTNDWFSGANSLLVSGRVYLIDKSEFAFHRFHLPCLFFGFLLLPDFPFFLLLDRVKQAAMVGHGDTIWSPCFLEHNMLLRAIGMWIVHFCNAHECTCTHCT